MNEKQYYVGFWDEQAKKKVYKIIKKYRIERPFDIAVANLKNNAERGNQIRKDLWPKKYKKNREIDNLWRYDLIRKHPGWRIVYTILPKNKIKILSAILEVLDHASYNRLFRYR